MKYFKLLTIYFMSISYTYVGVRHFIDPDFFLAIMPNYLPFHLGFVYLSGIAEISFGILLFFKKTRTLCSVKIMLWPGFEPGLSRPQREVLTTIRSQLCIAEDGFDSSTSGLCAQHASAAPLCLHETQLF